MKVYFCPNCRKETGHQRKLGFGTLFAVLLTGGLWLLTLPLYPPRCQICGSDSWDDTPSPAPNSGPPSDPDTKICPHCAETIKLAAKKCRFCGEILDSGQVERDLAARREHIQLNLSGKLCPDCGGRLKGPWCPHCLRLV